MSSEVCNQAFIDAAQWCEARIEELLPSVHWSSRNPRARATAGELVQRLIALGLAAPVRDLNIYKHRKQQACIALLMEWALRLHELGRVTDAKAGRDDAILQAACQTNECPEGRPSNDAVAQLPQTRRDAYLSYECAVRQMEAHGVRNPTDRRAYEWLVDRGPLEGAELGTFEAWARRLRRARSTLGEQKHRRAKGVTTRSVVSRESADIHRQQQPKSYRKPRVDSLMKIRENIGELYECSEERARDLLKDITSWLKMAGVIASEIQWLQEVESNPQEYGERLMQIVRPYEQTQISAKDDS